MILTIVGVIFVILVSIGIMLTLSILDELEIEKKEVKAWHKGHEKCKEECATEKTVSQKDQGQKTVKAQKAKSK